ncbi:MAG: delta-60 repeat domain-containing protein [Leptospiraceae bacterium]|nr:delta-60 repeat domain-containing protein [Leptospiraceae bacterium]
MKQNQGNKQKNIQSKPLRKIMIMIIAMVFVFTACHKKKKPFLLLPLIDNSSIASTDSGSGGPTFTPAIGVLDTSFNSPNGSIIQPISSFFDIVYSLAIQSDGKILLGGFCFNISTGYFDFCITRFNSNGTLDTTFGSNGIVIQDIGSPYDWGYSLAIQPDGKILLGGRCYTSNWDFCIARFNSNGTLDTTFGTSGKVIQPIGSSDDIGQSLAIQPDGKILLGGFCINGSNEDFCIARFNSNGTLDTNFGTGGKVIQDIGSSNEQGISLAIQPDGKILLGGFYNNGSNEDFCIARFNSNGTIDTTFGSSGKVIQPIGSSSDYGQSLAIQPDGKILLGGYCYDGFYNDFCIARFNSNGTLDTNFGTGGKVIQDIGSFDDYAYSLAIQPDGKILLGGTCSNGGNPNFCIARFQ